MDDNTARVIITALLVAGVLLFFWIMDGCQNPFRGEQ